jgi:hypothetical protein
MKELFDFSIKLNKQVEKTETKEENGQTITITSKVNEDVPIRIIFKQPSRKDIEEADLQFSVELSNCVKKGILTKGMLLKKYSDTGGVLSQDDDKRLTDLYGQISKLQKEYLSLSIKAEKTKEEEDAILEKIATARKQAVNLESTYMTLFNNTADTIAQNNVIRWFCVNMTHKQEGAGSIEPFFKGDTLDQKLDELLRMDEQEDEVYTKDYKKLATFVSFWYFSKNATKKDFEQLDKDIEDGKF